MHISLVLKYLHYDHLQLLEAAQPVVVGAPGATAVSVYSDLQQFISKIQLRTVPYGSVYLPTASNSGR